MTACNPVTLTPVQINELQQELSRMRHDVNNHLSLIVAAAELIKYKPELREKMMATLADQPAKIIAEISRFSRAFELAFELRREPPAPATPAP